MLKEREITTDILSCESVDHLNKKSHINITGYQVPYHFEKKMEKIKFIVA